MREAAVRRIPVVEAGRPVGVLSLGDAAVDRDPDSALADISSEEGNT
jgi:CBS domain-containing protein